MGTQRVQMKGVLPWLVRFVGLVVPVEEILSSIGCSGQPGTKYFFLIVHYFNLCVPIDQQPWQGEVVQGRLSLNVRPLRKIVILKSIHFLLIDVAHSK